MQETPIPENLKDRPLWGGYVVPYFATWYLHGKQCNESEAGAVPSFPVVNHSRLITCRKQKRCWICGKGLGAFKAFVFGPASAIARTSYEPPSHRDCARYALQVCPYLTNPDHGFITDNPDHKLKEGERVIPEVTPHNPGLGIMWVTRRYEVVQRDPSRGAVVLVTGDTETIELWFRGRKATYKEAVDCIQQSIRRNRMISSGANVVELAWRAQQLLSYVTLPEEPHGNDA
jgi:hypothetical protein